MRSLRLLGAGLLLLGALFALAALSLLSAVGAVTAVVFWVLWLLVAGFNGLSGVRAGYSVAEETPVFALVFGVPALVAGGLWWASSQLWQGGPVVHSGRTPLVLTTGVALWVAFWLLAGLLVKARTALVAFIVAWVAWVAWCAVNAVRGVVQAGYSVAEELGVFAINAVVPLAVALVVTKVAARQT